MFAASLGKKVRRKIWSPKRNFKRGWRGCEKSNLITVMQWVERQLNYDSLPETWYKAPEEHLEQKCNLLTHFSPPFLKYRNTISESCYLVTKLSGKVCLKIAELSSRSWRDVNRPSEALRAPEKLPLILVVLLDVVRRFYESLKQLSSNTVNLKFWVLF